MFFDLAEPAPSLGDFLGDSIGGFGQERWNDQRPSPLAAQPQGVMPQSEAPALGGYQQTTLHPQHQQQNSKLQAQQQALNLQQAKQVEQLRHLHLQPQPRTGEAGKTKKKVCAIRDFTMLCYCQTSTANLPHLFLRALAEWQELQRPPPERCGAQALKA